MISLQNVSKQFGSFTAVKNLTLSVPRGELFCFLGPNGAGKTTTIKMLTGLMSPTDGNITVGDIDLNAAPLEAKKIIGYIPDMPFLYERLTPVEFMEFIGDLYDLDRREVHSVMDDYFDTFGLMDYKTSLIRDFSHGMRQRLIYAATFLHKPEVLFIDEPLIALDPYTIRLIKDLLVRKTREGMTIFLTTHILALAEDIADRIGIISHGELATTGSKQELTARYDDADSLEDIFLRITRTEDAATTSDGQES